MLVANLSQVDPFRSFVAVMAVMKVSYGLGVTDLVSGSVVLELK
jgi:hypothetical protein